MDRRTMPPGTAPVSVRDVFGFITQLVFVNSHLPPPQREHEHPDIPGLSRTVTPERQKLAAKKRYF